MVLIRTIVLRSLVWNVRVFARFVPGNNYFSDALSRLKLDKFWALSKQHGKQFNSAMTQYLRKSGPYPRYGCETRNESKNLIILYQFYCRMGKESSKLVELTQPKHHQRFQAKEWNSILEGLKGKTTRSSTAHNYLAIWRSLTNFVSN